MATPTYFAHVTLNIKGSTLLVTETSHVLLVANNNDFLELQR